MELKQPFYFVYNDNNGKETYRDSGSCSPDRRAAYNAMARKVKLDDGTVIFELHHRRIRRDMLPSFDEHGKTYQAYYDVYQLPDGSETNIWGYK